LLAHNLQTSRLTGRILIVIAVLNTKDIESILSSLMGLADHWYLGEFKLQKCTPATDLAQCLTSLSQKAYDVFESVEEAYKAALQDAQPNDVIVVTGSFHTVAAVLEYRSVHY